MLNISLIMTMTSVIITSYNIYLFLRTRHWRKRDEEIARLIENNEDSKAIIELFDENDHLKKRNKFLETITLDLVLLNEKYHDKLYKKGAK